MKYDIVLAGVGGQGVLSVASILAEAARREGLTAKQAEVHGMAQRGGAVQAMLRLAEGPIASELVPSGFADMVLGLEPVEALRHLYYLAPTGTFLTAADPVADLADYPPIEEVHRQVRSLHGTLVEADRIARDAGSRKAANVVMLGAASIGLPLDAAILEECLSEAFTSRDASTAATNLAAFRAGRAAISPVGG